MTKKPTTPLYAAIFSTLLLATAPASQAQQAAPASPPPSAGVPQANYSNTELTLFVAAAQKVSEITQDYAPKVQQATGSPEQQELIAEADEKMMQAVQNEGISVEKFLDINQSVQRDPTLLARVEAINKARSE